MRFSFIEPFLLGKGEKLSRRLLAAPALIVPKARGTSDTGRNGRKRRFISRPKRPCRCDFRGNKNDGGSLEACLFSSSERPKGTSVVLQRGTEGNERCLAGFSAILD